MAIFHRLTRPPFRALIAAKDPPFSASHLPSSRDHDFNPNFDLIPTSIILKRAPFWRLIDCPRFTKIFGKYRDNLPSSEESLVNEPIYT